DQFYSKQEFYSEEEMHRKLKRYNSRYNNIAKKVLNFKTPNEIVNNYQFN
ncbi:MAG: IS481 family transposase, partial [Mollicutes bacterium]|nr:IS481 family transposase [Mollicutes bacterium]